MITIDLDELQCAMTDHGSEVDYFLDLETGEVLPRLDTDMVGEDSATDTLIDENPERFRKIENTPSWRSFEIMEAFVNRLPEGEAKHRLGHTLTRRKPFRNFKDALFEFGPLREDWFRFELESFAAIAKEWLKDEGIKAKLHIRPASDVAGDGA